MSADLIDLRTKIAAETHCALVAHARAHDVDMSELVRVILGSWGEKQIHGASMLGSCLYAKGLTAASEGIAAAAQGRSGNKAALQWETP